jgi:hypothetical protein
MSERVISDPTVAGWELNPDTGYWMWAAGGGSIQDGDTEGQITTWDGAEWTPEGAVVVDADGDTTLSSNRVYVGSEANSQIQFMKSSNNYLDFRGKLIMRHRYAADGGPNVSVMEIGADGNVNIIGKLFVNGVEVGGGGGGFWVEESPGVIKYTGTAKATTLIGTG